MNRLIACAILLSALFPVGAIGEPAVTIELATVGDPGNTPDPATDNRFGAVDYVYQIGIYEVTNAQYATFLNSVARTSDPHQLYHPEMSSGEHGGIVRTGPDGSYDYSTKPGAADKPVNYVSLIDAARFVNWLTNGQTANGTETGSYDLKGSTPRSRFVRMSAPEGCHVQYFVTSENEWHKAAYYDPTLEDGAGGYWLYPTRSNKPPSRLAPYGEANRANYGLYEKCLLNAGTYSNSLSYYGTFDQEGNVAEFTDTLEGKENRVRRGSHYANYLTGSAYRGGDKLSVKSPLLGFRVVAIAVEP